MMQVKSLLKKYVFLDHDLVKFELSYFRLENLNINK